jgi:predicted nucleic acid-binding protein
MPDNKVFLDTNIWVYLFASSQNAEDQRKKEIARQLLLDFTHITVSVQVLNELSNVWLKKYHLELGQIEIYLRKILDIAAIRFLDETLTFKALKIAQTYRLSFYDCLIVASALDAGCSVLFTEDMQDGQWIEERLQLRNPFHTTCC